MRRFSNAPPDWAFPDRVADDQAAHDEAKFLEACAGFEFSIESTTGR